MRFPERVPQRARPRAFVGWLCDVDHAVTQVTLFDQIEILVAASRAMHECRFLAELRTGKLLPRPADPQRFFDRIESDPLNPVAESVWAMAYMDIRNYDEALLRLKLAVDDQANNARALGEIRANSYQDPVFDRPRFRVLRNRIGT